MSASRAFEDEFVNFGVVDERTVERFRCDGFVTFPRSIFRDTKSALDAAHSAIDMVVRGENDTGRAATKLPRPQHRQGVPSTIHGINVRNACTFLDKIATSPVVGRLIAKLLHWPSVRLAEDQLWVKPPQATALTFHRDSTYFDFTPQEVCTLWITFDACLDTTLGPLEYCVGSHLWGDKRRGSAKHFFGDDNKALLMDAFSQQFPDDKAGSPIIVPVLAEAGGCAIHNGRTWHGSGPNRHLTSSRRGFGVHYIRGDAVFREPLGHLWAPYKQPGSLVVPDHLLPIIFRETREGPLGAKTDNAVEDHGILASHIHSSTSISSHVPT